MAEQTYQVFRKYTFTAPDKKAARKIWQGACANEQEEEFLSYEGMPKEAEEQHRTAGQEVKAQVTGHY